MLATILYKAHYDPVKDFAPISFVTNSGGMFVVNAALPVRTMHEFAAEACTRPGRSSYGTTLLRLVGEQLRVELWAYITMVSYKGIGPQLATVLGGRGRRGGRSPHRAVAR